VFRVAREAGKEEKSGLGCVEEQRFQFGVKELWRDSKR